MFENEEWREIEEFPHYLVSNYGRVKAVGRDEARKVTINNRGFPVILLSTPDGPNRFLRQINVLVAEAFLPSPVHHDETAIWHIDGNLANCRVDNLKWEMRSRVLEWNEMHRSGKPKYKTPAVKNNRTGDIYANAYECAMTEGVLETYIIARIEKYAESITDENARYRYLLKSELG